jgi:hypothetical protein
MPDSGIQALQAGPDVHLGAAVPFRFELSWRSLTQPEGLTVLPFVKRRDISAPVTLGPRFQQLPEPSFAIAADQGSFHKRIVVGAVGLLVVTLTYAAVHRRDQPTSAPAETHMATVEMGEAGWLTEWVTDPTGSSRGRQISLYRPSLPMSDYRLEFSGRIERKSLGWAFRRADARNYYVAKLQASKPGAPMTLVRYGVVRGVEDPHVQIPLHDVSSAGALKVRLDAKRSRFTIYVQNQIVADWEDHRLKAGGVGFLSEREERGQVDGVQISF